MISSLMLQMENTGRGRIRGKTIVENDCTFLQNAEKSVFNVA